MKSSREKPQVSVIVLTYNPNPMKLRQTLRAVAAQKEVCYELIISDDGSARKDFSFLPEYMETLGVGNYRLLEHEENRGTVQSCFRAVSAARGEYVFLTSPGDFLFDALVLRDLYRFAQANNAPLCFGNAVFYCAQEGVPRLTQPVGKPSSPRLYAPEASAQNGKLCFFAGDWVIGASYFRSRTLLLRCLEKILDTAKYMEDTTTTAFALAEGNRLCYCDRNVVWYEDGTGVSTGGNAKWDALLRQDLLRSLQKLKKLYPRDPCVDIAWRNISQTNRIKRLAGKLLCHGPSMLRLARLKKARKMPICCTDSDLQRLRQLLQTQ